MKPWEIKRILERYKDDFTVFALRVSHSQRWKAGNVMPPSRRWWEGEPVYQHTWIPEEQADQYAAKGYTVYTDRDSWCYHNLCYMKDSDFDLVIAVNEKAYMMEDGTSGILITPDTVKEALALIAKYKGDQLLLIGGKTGVGGYDKGEVIIPDAKVLAARKRPGNWNKKS